MKAYGVGVAHGAVSVLNAIPTGIGGAVGVDLKVKARAELLSDSVAEGKSIVRGIEVEIPQFILQALLETLKSKYEFDGGIRVTVESEVPIARGLKSSSALVNSILMGFFNALKLKYTTVDVAILGVEIAKKAGITVTGAFDDSLATVGKGLFITDNLNLKILKHMPVEDAYAVIHVPSHENPIYNIDVNSFRQFRRYYNIAVNLALQGKWKEAMMMNGLLTAIVIKSDPTPLLQAINSPGVIATGVSGKGPALVALTYDPEAVVNLWNNLEGEVLVTKLLGVNGEGEILSGEGINRGRC